MKGRKLEHLRSLKQKAIIYSARVEEHFLNQCIRLCTLVELLLINGERHKAVIADHDHKSIIIRKENGCQTLVYKNALSYIRPQVSENYLQIEDALEGLFSKGGAKYSSYYS
jgi:RNA chaperone Hfq